MRISFSFNRVLAIALALILTPMVFAQQVPETTIDPSQWLPVDVSTNGHNIDALFNFILYLTSTITIAVFILMIYFLVKYRAKPGRKVKFVHGNNRLEIVWTLIPTLILIFIAAYSESTWSDMKMPNHMPKGDNVVQVHVVARQFMWFFHYPGKDGIFGKTDFIWRQNNGDPEREIGLRRGDINDILSTEKIDEIRNDPRRKALLDLDPAANDDIVTTQMVVPVGKKVHCKITSIDVIHSFFLPNFRIKQDAMPGLNAEVWFQATKTSAQVIGTSPKGVAELGYSKPFDIACAELCGQGHFKMRGQLYVVTEKQFADYIALQAEDQVVTDDDENY